MQDYIRKRHALAHMLYLASNIFMHVNKCKCRCSITCREKEQDRLNIMGWEGWMQIITMSSERGYKDNWNSNSLVDSSLFRVEN